jgi:hypothetical protein
MKLTSPNSGDMINAPVPRLRSSPNSSGHNILDMHRKKSSSSGDRFAFHSVKSDNIHILPPVSAATVGAAAASPAGGGYPAASSVQRESPQRAPAEQRLAAILNSVDRKYDDAMPHAVANAAKK